MKESSWVGETFFFFVAGAIDYAQNKDLEGLSPLQVSNSVQVFNRRSPVLQHLLCQKTNMTTSSVSYIDLENLGA